MMSFERRNLISGIIDELLLPKQMRYQLRYTRTSSETYASTRLNASEICSICTQNHSIAPICTAGGREEHGKKKGASEGLSPDIVSLGIAQLVSILTNKAEIQKAAVLWSGVR